MNTQKTLSWYKSQQDYRYIHTYVTTTCTCQMYPSFPSYTSLKQLCSRITGLCSPTTWKESNQYKITDLHGTVGLQQQQQQKAYTYLNHRGCHSSTVDPEDKISFSRAMVEDNILVDLGNSIYINTLLGKYY